jgi:hypothetical protein
MLGMSVAAVQTVDDEGPYRIQHYTQCYADLFELSPWDIRMVLVYDTANIGILAQTRADVTRYRAVIFYNVPALALQPDSARFRVPIHELAHVLTADARWIAAQSDSAMGERIIEQLVSRIERWEFWQGMCP